MKNLIVISCDEMRWDAPGFMGNPDCKTPNLDRLAAQSVVFDRHFTVHGKCLPSRIAMMTGRYSHTDGFRTVMEENLLPDGEPNLLDCLKAHGYETAYFGHNHVFANLFTGNTEKGGSTPYYHSFVESDFTPFLDHRPAVSEPGANSLDPLPDTPPNFRVEKIRGRLRFFCDDNRADQAIHYLTTVRDRSKPFYLHLNFSAPHPAYAVEEPYFSMYDRDAIQPFVYDFPENAPLPLTAMRTYRSAGAEERHFRQLQAVYYGMVTKVDVLIGRVLETIEREGLWENTIVVFWVDHTDIAPTILDLLGFDDDWGIHGQSLLPMIKGEKAKEAVFADGGHEKAMRDRFNGPDLDKAGRPPSASRKPTVNAPIRWPAPKWCVPTPGNW